MLGLVAFFGLAAVTVDILGGVLAATMLARGIRPRRLLLFLAGYAAVVVPATLVLKPILRLLGGVLAPVLGSDTWLAVIQTAIGAALLIVAAYQRRSARRPPAPKAVREAGDSAVSLLGGGALFSATVLADPTYPVAVGMAMLVDSAPLEVLLLVAWNLVYQAPLVVVTAAALLGGHRRALAAASAFFGPRRRRLLLVLSAVLAIAGTAVVGDGIVALCTEHRPWLHTLLLLRHRA